MTNATQGSQWGSSRSSTPFVNASAMGRPLQYSSPHASSKSAQRLLTVLGQKCRGHRTRCSGRVGATEEVTLRLEQLQFDFGEGPCAATVETRSSVLQPDLAAMARKWSLYAGGALASESVSPSRSRFAFPLRVGDTLHLGALSCTGPRREPSRWMTTTKRWCRPRRHWDCWGSEKPGQSSHGSTPT